jgi:hypothetical protein
VNRETKSLKDEESSDKDNSGRDVTMVEADGSASSETLQLVEGGKKDPSIRRQELLVGSGLAKVCHRQIPQIPYLLFNGVSVSEKMSDFDTAVLCRTSLTCVLRMQKSCLDQILAKKSYMRSAFASDILLL